MSYVYIITNDAMPGCVKIGYTSREPHKRIREFYTTSMPARFKAARIFEFSTDSEGMQVEKFLHSFYKKSRLNGSREFFSSDILKSIDQTIKVRFPAHIDALKRDAEAKRIEEERERLEKEKSKERLRRSMYLQDVFRNRVPFKNLSAMEKNNVARLYLEQVRDEPWNDHYGFEFVYFDLSEVDLAYKKAISEQLFNASVEKGRKPFLVASGYYRGEQLLKSLGVDLSQEVALKGPSDQLVSYVYSQKSSPHRIPSMVKQTIGAACTYYSYHQKYVKMNEDYGNFSPSRASSEKKNIDELAHRWTDLKEVADGTWHREEFEKTMLGKFAKTFGKLW
jgi:hypothetical protein